MSLKSCLSMFLALGILAVPAVPLSKEVHAEEGMWTFDNPPLKQLQQKYGFTPTQEWLDHVRMSSVRFNDGGSGSFISSTGLVITNHHVARGQLQKMSTAEKDYMLNGFYAATPDQEIPCPDLELNVLQSMENVTRRVLGAAPAGASQEAALKSREAEIAKIEKESSETTKLRSDVVDLYHGGEYWLYRYKKYTEVKIVAAPEQQIAFFGGDPDNFTFPRYDLDFAIFRVYENGQPIKVEHYLKWNTKGPGKDELVFVSGHPGSTERLLTYDQLEFQREHVFPTWLKSLAKRSETARNYAKLGPEQARRVQTLIFGLDNSRKAITGEYEGLLDKKLMARLKAEDDALHKQVTDNPQWNQAYGDAWKTIAEVSQRQADSVKGQFFRSLRSRLFGIGLALVRYGSEMEKKDEERTDGYHDSQLEALKFNLLSPAPVYADLEEANLAGNLAASVKELGSDDPFIKAVTGGRPPETVAKELIGGTQLADVKARKALMDGGRKAIAESKDPIIVLARTLEPILRAADEQNRKIESVLTPATQKVAEARFAVYGKNTYPDATFTLRLSYGTVTGYPMNGTVAPYKTTLYGLYDRALSFDNQGDFALPERFVKRKDKLDLTTPVNFVSTCDIIGGNSGSPVINRNGEFVGLIFDGNIESLPGNFAFDITANRAVSVHPAFIIEALRKLYDAAPLADEIEGKAAQAKPAGHKGH